MAIAFKRVPAIDKCFAILDLFTGSNAALGISDISRKLGYAKSTVYNTVHTLLDLNVLETKPDGKFGFGTRLFTLGSSAGNRSMLIQTVHPYLEAINRETNLSVFLGLRSGRNAIIVDKVDTSQGIKVSSEIGMRMPLLAGVGGKAMLSLLPDEKVNEIISASELKRYSPKSIVDKEEYKAEIYKARTEGIAFDMEEYIEGLVAFGVPISAYHKELQVAIWAVGLKRQLPDETLRTYANYLKQQAWEIDSRLSLGAGPAHFKQIPN